MASVGGWLAWAASAPPLAAGLRVFADVLAGRPDPGEFRRLARHASPVERRDALALLRLARLAGCARQLHRSVWKLMMVDFEHHQRWPDEERLAWARELAALPVDLPKEMAELDVSLVLLGARPAQPLRARMADRYWQEYRGSVLAAYRAVIGQYGDGAGGLAVVTRVMDGFAGSLSRDGWPADRAADETLVFLELFARGIRGTYVSPAVRSVVEEFLDGRPKHGVDEEIARRWRVLLRTAYSGPYAAPPR
jgi:hypothetical protein